MADPSSPIAFEDVPLDEARRMTRGLRMAPALYHVMSRKSHIPSHFVVRPEPFTMGLRVQYVTLMVSHQLTTPDDLGVTHGHSGQTDPRKPDYHRRFPERSDVFPTAWRWEGVPRMCHRLHHVPWLSTQAQGDLSRRWCLTRHSPYMRVRLSGVTIWRLQCTRCKAVFTVLPHFILRYRQMRPEVARHALLATHGGLSLELCAVIEHISPMALYRLICALGQHRLVAVLTRCGRPLPVYFLADEKHSRCRTHKAYLPTIVRGRVIWHLGYTEDASATALTQSYQEFQRMAIHQEPTVSGPGILTDGFDSTTKSMRTLFPGARLGNCLRHALIKLPKKLAAIASPVRKALRSQFHTLWYRARQRKGLRVFALGQRLRRFADHVTITAGTDQWRARATLVSGQEGRLVCGARRPPDARDQHPLRPGPQRHRAEIVRDERVPSSQWQPTGVSHGAAHLYNLVPYQRRAQHGGQCGVEVEGGTLPTRDWFLNLQILTSGGFR